MNKEELIEQINDVIESLDLPYETYESVMVSIIKILDSYSEG